MYLRTYGSFKSRNHKRIGSANSKSANGHICGRSPNQTNYFSCGFAVCGIYADSPSFFLILHGNIYSIFYSIFVRRKVCICGLTEVLSPEITKGLGPQIANPQMVTFAEGPQIKYLTAREIIIVNCISLKELQKLEISDMVILKALGKSSFKSQKPLRNLLQCKIF
jgi:hypothetical protein